MTTGEMAEAVSPFITKEDFIMEGPMDRLFGHSAFDLNRDGKIDGAEWAFINDTFFEDNNGISTGSSIEEVDDVLDELEFMDEDERREALEDAGLDPDDFDDEF